MQKITMCRICLVKNVNMYEVANKDLQKTYEKLTDIPFVTEDCRPMLACFFCYAKLKQCCQLLRKSLKAEEVFAQMLNGDYEQIPIECQSEMEFCGGLIKTSVEYMSIGADTEQLPAVCDIKDEIELKEEYLTFEVECLEDSYQNQEDTPSHQSELDSKDDPLLNLNEEKEVPEKNTSTKMPRNYKSDPRGKQYRKYDQNTIKQALEEYETTPQCSLAYIAEKYNINKSVLYRHNRKTMKTQGGQNALDEDTERHIVHYLNICGNWGYPLDTQDLRIFIKLYLDNLGISHTRFKNNMPGPEYATRFLYRHKDSISSRMCQNIKKSRALVTPDTINEYFEELEESLKEIDPTNIISYDETNLSDDPGLKKVLMKRGAKYPERVLNQPKSSISIMMAGTAAGELLPPYVIYNANNIYDTWTTGGPKGARYNITASGWIDGSTFEDYIKSIVIPFFKDKPGKKVLIGDHLSTHISIEVIRICEQQNISFIFLPANSTHLTQPLDIAFFKPMKVAWSSILLKWKKTDGRTQPLVPKESFPRLLRLLINDLSENVEINLKAGFRKAGIIPVDRNQVLSRLPSDNKDPDKSKYAELPSDNKDPDKSRFAELPSDDNEVSGKSRYAGHNSDLQVLTEMRYDTINVKEPTRKRKLNAESGLSLGNIDDDNLGSASDHEITNKTVKNM